ncbi:CBN-DPY-27 protein [Caenorhabditis brenneri]|uniref:CBN-DPY-27 protein n=1 Tax=Caenorhabditis brenneri TaxID=135651 RepID=G0MVT8_CAEBE|nr:CBN-DPY-27 protein [Caenorhabditis brenneri]
MKQINFVEHMPDEPEPEFHADNGEKYDEQEDLLNMEIPEINHEVTTGNGKGRLVLKDIFVENFKSYKGRHQIGPLHKNLTMVVGPNGSGKSNVIDALLFVFGFKAKKIRTTKMTSLIYNLDNECDYALVEVQFVEIFEMDNGRYEVNLANCINIARTVQKTGSTYYYLDGRTVSQKEIQEVLRRVGIDLNNNRFLILQGEVEAISLMKPTARGPGEEGMLEYIESIVGTDQLVIPILKLAHRCRVLEYRVSNHAIQCRRHQATANLFRKVLQGAINYINARNNLNMINGILAKHALEGQKVALRGAELSTGERKNELDAVAERYDAVKGEMRTAVQEKSEIYKELKTLETQKLDYTNYINDWHQEDRRHKNNCKAALQAFKAIVQEIESIKAEILRLNNSPQDYKNAMENMQIELEQLRNQKANIDRVYTQNIAKYDQKVTQERKKLEKLNAEVDAMAQHYTVQQEELLVAENELREMKVTDPNDLKGADEMKEELKNLAKDIEKHNAGLARVQRELEGFQEKIRAGMVARTEAEKMSNEAFKNKQKLMDELQYLSQMDVDNSYHKRATHALEKLKREGKFDGFIGRLGDMAYCNKKYDAAMSTVFGANLDWHIVQTKEDSQKAIEHLRLMKLPRSTFVSLDAYDKDTNKNKAQMYQSTDRFPAPRLFDQLHFDNEMAKRILYKVMGDVLIVDCAADAIRLHKKQRGVYRYSTYDGTYVDYNGSLSGGGKPSTGRIRLSKKKPVSYITQQAEIDRVNGELDRCTKEIEDADKKMAESCALINENQEYVNAYMLRVKATQEKIAEIENKAMMLENLIPDAEARKLRITRVITEKDQQAKQAEIEELRRAFNELFQNIENKKTERDRLEQAIEAMFGQMVGVNKEKLKEISTYIEKLEREIAEIRIKFENVPQTVAGLQTKLVELERVCGDRKADHDKAVASDPPERQDQLQQLMDMLEEIRHALEAKNKEMDDIRVAISELENEQATAYTNYAAAEENYNATQVLQNIIENDIVKAEQTLKMIPHLWLAPENLDPEAKWVKLDDPMLNEKLKQQYLVMPEEVERGVETKYKEQFEETVGAVVSQQQLQDFKQQKRSLERNLEHFRIEHDEKGISDFARLVLIQMNEVEMYNKAAIALRQHREKLAELRALRYNEFNKALVFLSTTTQLLYSLITNGGDASLKFVEEGRSDDPFVGGIKFSVRPAKKSWKLIENLSGGEKTLASLCFVFAMHHYRPTPLYVMDEIDAALDIQNVRLIAEYIRTSERTRNAQFLIISLRNQMFELGNRLVGIYKTEGSTKNIVINPEMIEQRSKRALAILEKKLAELRIEEGGPPQPSAEDARLAQEMSQVRIAPKIQRRLGTIRLQQFGIGSSPAPGSRCATPRAQTPRAETPISPARSSTRLTSAEPDLVYEDSDDQYYEAGEDRQPRKKKRKQVITSDEEDEDDDSVTPPPSNQPSTSDGRVQGGDRFGMDKYARPTPTLELASDKRRRK